MKKIGILEFLEKFLIFFIMCLLAEKFQYYLKNNGFMILEFKIIR